VEDDTGSPSPYRARCMASSPRTAVWATALGLAVLQVVGSIGASSGQSDRKAVDAVAVVLLLLGPGALAVRDRWPLAAVVVTLVATDVYVGLGYPYGPVFAGVVLAIFTAVGAGHRRATVVLAAAGFGGFVLAFALDSRSEGSSAAHLALVAGWLVVVLAVSEVFRIRRVQAAERERGEVEERQRRVAEQRLVLAQDLHDVLAHNISLINVQASVALHLLDEQPERARPALANIKAASRDALHELRSALDLLRHGEEAPRAPAPGLSDLEQLVAGVRASGLEVELARAGPRTPLSGAVELAAYRIVQEALTNVTRHAGAGRATVAVGLLSDHVLTVEVTDDGVGGPAGPAGPGNGIRGMQERAASLGGSLEAGPRIGGGFRVVARLPVAPL
jgi:signal transduction histidine kinase